MRRTASEILNELELRIARLEKIAGHFKFNAFYEGYIGGVVYFYPLKKLKNGKIQGIQLGRNGKARLMSHLDSDFSLLEMREVDSAELRPRDVEKILSRAHGGRVASSFDRMSAYPEFPDYYRRWNSESNYQRKPEYRNTLKSNELLKKHGFSFLREENHTVYFDYRGVEVYMKLANLSDFSEIKKFLRGASDLYEWVEGGGRLAVGADELKEIIEDTYGSHARNTLHYDLAYFFLNQVLRKKVIYVEDTPKKREMTNYERQKLKRYLENSGNNFYQGRYIGEQKIKYEHEGVRPKDKYVPIGWRI